MKLTTPSTTARVKRLLPRICGCASHRAVVWSQQRTFASRLAARSLRPRHDDGIQWRLAHQSHHRGKKTKTVINLEDLPQGVVENDDPPIIEEPVEPALPTVILQARRNMIKFDKCVLLTRVGGFYELYLHQAEEYGPLLNLKVAQKKTSAGPVSMAGFPFFQLDRFLKVLVQDLNRYVAIAEEFPNDVPDKIKSGGLLHDRRVARIITPGTLIDENFMDPYVSNYVMAVHVTESEGRRDEEGAFATTEEIGLAWLDLSTGHFFTQETTLASLGSVLTRVCPREIVLDERLQSIQNSELSSILTEERHVLSYTVRPQRIANMRRWTPMLESEMSEGYMSSFAESEVNAGSLLLEYVKDRLQGINLKLQQPKRYVNSESMTIDKNGMRSLEIKQTIRDNAFRGSLLHAIRRTVTKSGARLLNEWLSAPSTSLQVIGCRQDLVAHFIADETLREGIITLLRRSHDSQRLVQKFALGRGDPDDLLDLASTVRAARDINAMLEQASSAAPNDSPTESLLLMSRRMDLAGPLKLAEQISEAIDEEGVDQQHQIEDSKAGDMMALTQEIIETQGSAEDASILPKSAAKKKRQVSLRDFYGEDNEVWIMKPQASPTLKRLHAELQSLCTDRDTLTESLRDRLDTQSLTLRWAPGLGHICHIKGKRDMKSLASASIPSLTSRQTTRSFHHADWTLLGRRLDATRTAIRAEEQLVLHHLRQRVIHNIVKLRRNASVLDELDITTSFAVLALEQNLVRPILNASTTHTIIGGRHPTVEGGLQEAGRTFTSNDCFVGSSSSSSSHPSSSSSSTTPHHGRIWLITGPNMAGKSTFLRQNALITILAQIGCYVPAAYAEIGIVDAIFSRVGSADNLYRDQSTFMLEMLETAHILRNATPRSFVVMDEVGRGTTPEDGAAVAFACLKHLVTVNRCRTLFATHFHGIADLVRENGMEVGQVLGNGGGGGDDGRAAVEMYCTDVQEDGHGGFVYVHKLRKGVNRRSHALKVAKLAGLPDAAIQTARSIFKIHGPDGISGAPVAAQDVRKQMAGG